MWNPVGAVTARGRAFRSGCWRPAGTAICAVLVDRQRADSDVDLMGSIGHELQHAIEALSDNNRFEMTAAIIVGTAIRDELRRQEPLARSR
jgi:3-dehydroquinate synthetase